MKPQTNSKKTIVIVVVAVVVLAIVYFYFSGGTPAADSISTLQSQSASAVGTRVLSLLNQIKSLRIDTSVFKDPAYQTLVDYSVEIPQLPVGRPNPFAPIPGVSTNQTGAANAAR